jgi:hypothetical protein
MSEIRFSPGSVVATPGVLEAFRALGNTLRNLRKLHTPRTDEGNPSLLMCH